MKASGFGSLRVKPTVAVGGHRPTTCFTIFPSGTVSFASGHAGWIPPLSTRSESNLRSSISTACQARCPPVTALHPPACISGQRKRPGTSGWPSRKVRSKTRPGSAAGMRSSETASRTKSPETNNIAPCGGKVLVYRLRTNNPLTEALTRPSQGSKPAQIKGLAVLRLHS